MKKLLGILVLSLLWCNVGFADYSDLKHLEMTISDECKVLKIWKHRMNDYYNFNMENRSSKNFRITSIKLFTEKDEEMYSNTLINEQVRAFKKISFRIYAGDLIHDMVKKIFINCKLKS